MIEEYKLLKLKTFINQQLWLLSECLMFNMQYILNRQTHTRTLYAVAARIGFISDWYFIFSSISFYYKSLYDIATNFCIHLPRKLFQTNNYVNLGTYILQYTGTVYKYQTWVVNSFDHHSLLIERYKMKQEQEFKKVVVKRYRLLENLWTPSYIFFHQFNLIRFKYHDRFESKYFYFVKQIWRGRRGKPTIKTLLFTMFQRQKNRM